MKNVLSCIFGMWYIFFASNNVFGNSGFIKSFLDDCTNKLSKVVVIQHDEVKLWDSKSNSIHPLYKNKSYKYITTHESISSPSLCFKNKKILLAKNVIAENIGRLILVDLDEMKEELLHEGKGIRSPTISDDQQRIAYLSNYTRDGLFTLFVYELSTKKTNQIIDNVHGGGYNYNVSWSPDGNDIAYSDADGYLNLVNVHTKKIKRLTKGYNPQYSPDGKQILFANDRYKPYKPLIYNIANGKVEKLGIYGKAYNAIWAPDCRYILIVKMDSSFKNIIKLNEWGKKVVVYDISTKKVAELFKYEGFEYIDFK